MKNKLYLLLAATLSTQLFAQPLTSVIELDNSTDSGVKQKPSAANLQSAQQFYQMQVLKDEVQTLRGMVEELTYQLQQVKQRQFDDYLDIDRRLIAISASAVVKPGNEASGVDTLDQPLTDSILAQASPEVFTPEDIEADYAASSLFLKEKDFDGAIAAFKNHIEKFPDSPFVANAYYWLGEIYEFRGAQALAIQSFSLVVNSYSSHNKAMDSRYKLGKLYHKLGDSKQAKALLEEAASSKGGAGAKARAYIKSENL